MASDKNKAIAIGIDVQGQRIEVSVPPGCRSVLAEILLPDASPQRALEIINNLEKRVDELTATFSEPQA